jgi:Shikimate dehydrogenase substrate binding domain/Type I 3-dehydroquinase
MIAINMGERGVITRILAPKYGGVLTFGSSAPGAESAPGQLTIAQLKGLYRLHEQTSRTRVFGIVGNPVSHSKSPLLHNNAMAEAALDAVYVPLLVDDMEAFLATFSDLDWQGFSVTIPHKAWSVPKCCYDCARDKMATQPEFSGRHAHVSHSMFQTVCSLEPRLHVMFHGTAKSICTTVLCSCIIRKVCVQEAACRLSSPDGVAAKIGAVNTLVRQPDGSLAGHNTDWEAAISAVQEALTGADLPVVAGQA